MAEKLNTRVLSHPTRRDALKLGLAAGLAATWSGSAFAQQATELKFSSFTPAQNAAIRALTGWTDKLEAETDGAVKTTLFASSQMGPPNRQYDLVRDGVADLSWVLHGFTPGRFPLTEIGQMPGLFTDVTEGTERLQEASEYLLPEYKGVKTLAIVASPVLLLFTRDKAVRTLADMKGMRIRPPSGVTADAIQALGGASVAVPAGEMSEALAKGIIDGIVTTSEAATTWQIWEHVKYVTNINFGIATFSFVMNPAAYDRLPDDVKPVFDKLTPEIAGLVTETFANQEETAIKDGKEAGAEFIEPDGDELINALNAFSVSAVEKMDDETATKVFDVLRK